MMDWEERVEVVTETRRGKDGGREKRRHVIGDSGRGTCLRVVITDKPRQPGVV